MKRPDRTLASRLSTSASYRASPTSAATLDVLQVAFVIVGEFGAGPVEVGAPSFALAAPEIFTAW